MAEGRIWNGTSWVAITDEGHRSASDPHTQYHNNARGDARYSLLAHEHDHLPPLPEDTYAEADPITDYPNGVSIMPVSDTAGGFGWDGNEDPASILTCNVAGARWQRATWRHTGNPDTFYAATRIWDESASDWAPSTQSDNGWNYEVNTAQAVNIANFAVSEHEGVFNPHPQYFLGTSVHSLAPFSEDGWTEAALLDEFDAGIQSFSVSAGANWGPNTGQSGLVVVETNDDFTSGVQIFTQDSNGNSYRRVWMTTAWGSWDKFSMEGHAHSAADITSGTLDDARIPSGIARDSEVSSAISTHEAASDPHTGYLKESDFTKAAIDALDVDADTLDGHDTPYFATATSVSDHLADTSAAHAASAISYAGSTNLTATEVEAALDELDTEKVAATRAISTTAPLTGGGDLSANRTLAVSAASDTASGVVELATDAEAQTGTDTARAITPANLSARSATETRTGVIEIATQAETNTGTDDARAITPLKLKTNVDLHINDTSAAHAASAISYAGSTNLTATEVEAALDELDTEKASTGSVTTVQTNLTDHLNDTVDAHDASAVSFSPTGTVAATDVQSAIAEVASETSSGGLSLTEVEVDLGSQIVQSGNFQITGLSGLTAGHHVLIRQAPGPYTGKGTLADEYEMDSLSVAGKVTNATTIQCYWKSDGPVRGNFKFAYAVG